METSDLKSTIRERYGRAALQVVTGAKSSCCGGSCAGSADDRITSDLYTSAQTAAVPQDALLASLGCGNPTALAELHEGEVVLDLGSGGGIDVLLSARRVGPSGKAYGLDMTDEMLALARENQRKAGLANVEFLKGDIEAIPLPDRSVDVIISNCVVNLSPDKLAVFREAFRVLKLGGRIAIADIVASSPLPDAIRNDRSALVGCIAGALAIDEVRSHLTEAGFTDIAVEVSEASRSFIKGWNPGSGVEEFVASAAITARRPSGDGCCGSASSTSCC